MTNTAIQQQEPMPQPYLVRVVDLLTAIKFVQPAQSREETRYYLCGVYFDKQAGKPLNIVATDGHRLHKISIGEPDDAAFNMIIPTASIKEMVKHLTKLKKTESGCVLMQKGEGLAIDNVALYPSVDARFPDYNRVIPNATEQALFSCYYARYLADTFAAFDKLGYGMVKAYKADSDNMSPIVIKAIDDGAEQWNALAVIMPMRG